MEVRLVRLLEFGVHVRGKFTQIFGQADSDFATMPPHEFFNHGQKAQYVAHGTDFSKGNVNRLPVKIQHVLKNFLAARKNFNMPANELLLH